MKNTGTLRIQTFAARQSAPVEGVTVAVISATTSIRNDHTAATRKYHAAMFSDTSEVSDCMV